MNKEEFIEELIRRTGYDKETCLKINDCLEENFIIGKKNKEKTINLLMDKLNISKKDADNIYNIASSIITTEIKNKLKHPFKSQH